MHAIELPEVYALVLQHVDEVEQEDFTTLAETLCLERSKLSHIVAALKNKGLIKVRTTTQDSWISLSSRGRRLINMLWPEAHNGFAY